MLKTKMLFVGIISMTLLILSCKNSSSKSESSSTSEKTEEATTKRPDTSDVAARKLVGKHDYAVGTLMRNIREFKETMDKGAKMTPVVETNLTDLLNEAKQADAAITDDVKAKLNEDDYGTYSRNTKRLKEKETELEGLKQLK